MRLRDGQTKENAWLSALGVYVWACVFWQCVSTLKVHARYACVSIDMFECLS